MKIAQGRIENGAIVTSARFKEGTRLTLIQNDNRAPVVLTLADESAIVKGIKDIAHGQSRSLSAVRRKLARRRRA